MASTQSRDTYTRHIKYTEDLFPEVFFLFAVLRLLYFMKLEPFIFP